MKNISEQGEGVAESIPHAGMKMDTPNYTSDQDAPGGAQAFELTSSLAQRIFAVIINLMVLGELTIAMYFASQKPESLTPVFFKIFFGLLIPTLVLAFFVKRFINIRALK